MPLPFCSKFPSILYVHTYSRLLHLLCSAVPSFLGYVMTLRTAYMAMAKLPSCQEDPLLQSMCREWVWEYILKHCSNKLLIRALLDSYPIPPHSLSLKRLFLLKFLYLDVVDEDLFSERTVEILSELSPSSSSSSSSSTTRYFSLKNPFTSHSTFASAINFSSLV